MQQKHDDGCFHSTLERTISGAASVLRCALLVGVIGAGGWLLLSRESRHPASSTSILRHSPFLLQNLHPEKCAASVHDWLRAEQADNAAHLCIETAATLVLEVVTVP